MNELFASGRIVELILLLVLLEVVAVALYRGLTGQGPRLRRLAPTLVSGGLLLLALRAALADAWWGLVALPLLGALLAHLWDLSERWAD